MYQEIKDQWLAALRSGEYKQANGTLTSGVGEYCVLGVLIHLAVEAGVEDVEEKHEYHPIFRTDRFESLVDFTDGPRWSADFATLPDVVVDWAGLESANPYVNGQPIAVWNDGEDLRGLSFAELADLIEAEISTAHL